MPLDQSLIGHETSSEHVLIAAEDIREFADAIGDANPIFHDEFAAQQAGFTHLPVTPTFVTRLRVSFADAGLDPEHSQVLHGEQEYVYTRPLLAGETVVSRHRVATIRQSGRGGMAIMTLEHLCDTPNGERIVTGKSTVLVRDMPPEGAAAAGAGAAKPRPTQPQESTSALTLSKHVTQEQINAYAEVSGDHNPIHVNPEAARSVGLDGTIAHGMLSMAFAGQMLTDWLAAQAERGGWVARLRVRFQAMVRPGDTLICHGNPGERAGNRQPVELWIENQHGERVISGDAEVAFP
jgi:acyl dehydratase